MKVRPDPTVKPVPCSGLPFCGSNHNRRSVPAHRGLRSERASDEKVFRCRAFQDSTIPDPGGWLPGSTGEAWFYRAPTFQGRQSHFPGKKRELGGFHRAERGQIHFPSPKMAGRVDFTTVRVVNRQNLLRHGRLWGIHVRRGDTNPPLQRGLPSPAVFLPQGREGSPADRRYRRSPAPERGFTRRSRSVMGKASSGHCGPVPHQRVASEPPERLQDPAGYGPGGPIVRGGGGSGWGWLTERMVGEENGG